VQTYIYIIDGIDDTLLERGEVGLHVRLMVQVGQGPEHAPEHLVSIGRTYTRPSTPSPLSIFVVRDWINSLSQAFFFLSH
jgi:hypothetical protein